MGISGGRTELATGWIREAEYYDGYISWQLKGRGSISTGKSAGGTKEHVSTAIWRTKFCQEAEEAMGDGMPKDRPFVDFMLCARNRTLRADYCVGKCEKMSLVDTRLGQVN